MPRSRYRRRADAPIVAVQIRLDTEGLRYRKWGHDQVAKPGDWIVDNGGDVYTVDARSFADTYREVGRGTYVKCTPVWAEQAVAPGSVATREGRTDYAAGDWIVSNREDGGDAYAVTATTFAKLYEIDT
jgi:hypothetical protein